MARPLRIELAGGVYHVTSRGDRKEAIYLDDEDRLLWLSTFSDVCARYNWRCHGWCQMTNHYHILVETVEANLSRGMRQLNGVYTRDIIEGMIVSVMCFRGVSKRSLWNVMLICLSFPVMWY